ncbi:MAG: polysaccharide deacetylase family protein [Tissierellia bacterium]|nr:polysaccharide deacetylase family protein [Tissierellia bacterium]
MLIKNVLNKKSMICITLIILLLAIGYFEINNIIIQTFTSPSVKLPIIMYHHVLKDSKKWGKYVISPNEFEDDIIYLKKEGYTTVVMQDIIDYVYNKKPLPLKPIILTFDDGYLSNYEYIIPILEKHDCKAVISVVGEYIETSSGEYVTSVAYSYMDWDHITEAINSKYIEIQNHSYSMHKIGKRKGASKKNGESFEEYKNALVEDIGKMQILIEEKTGYRPNTFTYPYGFASKESNQILTDMGFLATLSCNSGINYLSGNKEELYNLKRFNRANGVSQEDFFRQFEK